MNLEAMSALLYNRTYIYMTNTDTVTKTTVTFTKKEIRLVRSEANSKVRLKWEETFNSPFKLHKFYNANLKTLKASKLGVEGMEWLQELTPVGQEVFLEAVDIFKAARLQSLINRHIERLRLHNSGKEALSDKALKGVVLRLKRYKKHLLNPKDWRMDYKLSHLLQIAIHFEAAQAAQDK